MLGRLPGDFRPSKRYEVRLEELRGGQDRSASFSRPRTPPLRHELPRGVGAEVCSVSLGVPNRHCVAAVSGLQPNMHMCWVTCVSSFEALAQVTTLTTCTFTKHFLSTHLGQALANHHRHIKCDTVAALGEPHSGLKTDRASRQ